MTERLDKIDDRLAEFCSAGYALGLIGEANIAYVVDHYPELVMVQRVYRLGDQAQLKRGVDEDTLGIDELEEFLANNWEDYPVFDDEYLSEAIAKAEEYAVNELATGWNIPAELVWDAVRELDGEFEWEQDYAYYGGDVDELKVKATELGQTWVGHYYGGLAHTPEVCKYCVEAEVA